MSNFNFGVSILPTVTDGSLTLGSNENPWTLTGSLTGNASTATQFASAQKVYVTLGTASTTTTITGGSSSAQTIGVNGTLSVANGGTGKSSFTANRVIMSGSSTTGQFTDRAVTNNTSNTAITASTNFPTMNTIYHGLVTVNNASQTRATGIYAPTSAGTKNTQAIVSAGSGAAPVWKNISPSVTIGSLSSSAGQTLSATVLGQTTSGTLPTLGLGTTSYYGVVKLNSAISNDSTSETTAVTPKGVWSAITAAGLKIGTQTKYPGKSNGNEFSTTTLKADLGLSSALTYRGSVSSKPASTSGYSNGDVIIVTSGTNAGVYVCNGSTSAWDSLGTSVAYKIMQVAVSDPSVVNSATSTSFISAITQDTNGMITPTKANVPTATTSALGLMKVGTGLSASSGTVSVSYGTPGALGNAASAGSANTAARSDHVHPYPTAAQVGAAKIAITANMGTMTNSATTAGTVSVTKTVSGVTSDMTVDRLIIGSPAAFMSDITVTTNTNSVTVSATLAGSASSAISVKLSNNSDVTGT